MKNGRLFDKSDLKILSDSEKWKLVCSCFPSEAQRINDSAHERWLEANSDRHSQREILLTLKGKSICSLKGSCYECPPGTLFFFDSFEEHDKNYPESSATLEHLWIYILGRRIIARIIQVEEGKVRYLPREYIIDSDHLVLTLQHAWNKALKSGLPDDFKRRRLISAISLILMEIVEKDLHEDEETPAKTHQSKMISMIKNHIKETAGKGSSIEHLAHIAGYSKFHFLRIFKEYTGQRIHAYINEVRIKKVKSMLQEGYMKKEISDELGFSCPAAFANWYKKKFKE